MRILVSVMAMVLAITLTTSAEDGMITISARDWLPIYEPEKDGVPIITSVDWGRFYTILSDSLVDESFTPDLFVKVIELSTYGYTMKSLDVEILGSFVDWDNAIFDENLGVETTILHESLNNRLHILTRHIKVTYKCRNGSLLSWKWLSVQAVYYDKSSPTGYVYIIRKEPDNEISAAPPRTHPARITQWARLKRP